MDGVADSDHIASSTNIQIGSGESDQTRIGHSMQIPTTAKGQNVKAVKN